MNYKFQDGELEQNGQLLQQDFPLKQIFELIDFADQKYFQKKNSQSWAQKKYEIIKASNNQKKLQILKEISQNLISKRPIKLNALSTQPPQLPSPSSKT